MSLSLLKIHHFVNVSHTYHHPDIDVSEGASHPTHTVTLYKLPALIQKREELDPKYALFQMTAT